eukprot:7020994-Pyramimonas_sp.AAC.1
MGRGIVRSAQWGDARDVTADGHAKGCIDRELLLQVVEGIQPFKYELERYAYRGNKAAQM